MKPVGRSSFRLLPAYQSFEHLKSHIANAPNDGITICMNKHLLAGATMDELFFLAAKDNSRLNSNDFLDAPRIRRHIDWCRQKGMIIDRNRHGVIRLVGYRGQRDAQVMSEFESQRTHPAFVRLPPKIESVKKAPEVPLDEDISLDEDTHSCSEGAQFYAIHRKRERNPELVRVKKQKALSDDPLLRCEACGISMFEQYGERGKSFCEIHHRTPLFLLQDDETAETSLDHLAVLCPNCHRIIHRSRHDTLTVDSLKDIVSQQRER